jgi:glucosyl-3-phosphoglycerate phosphatase
MRDRLILMRHGQTAWNAQGRFTTRSDVPLDETGLAQARAGAQALAATEIDRIYCSPMLRARSTAEAVAAARAQPLEVTPDPRLTEIDSGPFEGLTVAEIEAGPLAAAFASWHTDGNPVFPQEAETFDHALVRIAGFLDEHRNLHGTTLVVTHGSLARLAVTTWLLGAEPGRHRRMWLDNCRVAVVDSSRGAPQLVAFNVAAPN